MKKLTFILGAAMLIMMSMTLLSAKPIKKRFTIPAYCPTGNPGSTAINVHLWNPNHDYNFVLPVGAGPGYVLGQIADECDYSVTLSSSSPHTMQFYWFYVTNTTSATQNGGMCLTCGSCPTFRVYN